MASVATQSASDPFLTERMQMVREQLKERDITHARVLAAIEKIARHAFVPDEWRKNSYTDQPLPIGHGQTISQPYIVAFMTQVMDPKPTDRVLEVGTGSGYQAAILAELTGHVYTIEIIPQLAEKAERRLKELGYKNISFRTGDGYLGWKENAPFDSIMVTAGAGHVPQPLIEQLRPGGKIIIPVGDRLVQELKIVFKGKDGKITETASHPVRFVPLTRSSQ